MRRFFLVALAVTSSFALYLTSGAKFCLLATAILAICGFVGWKRPLPISMRMVAVAAVLCVVGSFTFSLPIPRPNGFIFFPAFAYTAGLFSCLGTAILLLRRHKGWEEQLVIATTIATLLLAGNTTYAFPFGYSVIAYTLILILYLRAEHFRVRPSTAVTSLLVVGLGIGFAMALSNSQAGFRDLMSNMQLWSSSVNFGDTAGIKPQTGPGSKKVVMRVFADQPEPYYVSRRYLSYKKSQWKADGGANLTPTASPHFPGESTYILRGEVSSEWTPTSKERVELTTLRPEALPLPLKSRLVAVSLSRAKLTPTGDLLVAKAGAGFSGGYTQALGSLGITEDSKLLKKCLEAEVDPRVSALAHEIAGDRSDKLKVFALQRFFQENFEYGFGYPFDKAEDPVATFLEERPPAHCEVYATCMTLMCRSVGVPARYVQGFLVRERNDWGDYWVSRESDAHAWVEVYIEGMGWVTVDPTPPGVSEERESDSSWREFGDVVKRFFQRVWAQLSRGPQALLQDFGNLLLEHPVVSLLVFLGILGWNQRKRLRGLFRPREDLGPEKETHPEIDRMQKLYHRFEAAVAEEKPDDLTLLEWSREVKIGRDFLREYSELRYSMALPETQRVDALEDLLRNVESSASEAKVRE